jgi:hypothetical protein
MSKTSLLNTAQTLLGMGGEFAEVATFVKEQIENVGETIVSLKITIEGLTKELQEAKSENVVLKSQIPVAQ